MEYEARPGDHILSAAEAMVKLSIEHGENVNATFNDIKIVATPSSTAGDITQFYYDEMERRSAEYESSEKGKADRERARVERERRIKALADALAVAPPITLRDEPYWRSMINANTDGYGAGVIRYAEKWARLMESRMVKGATMADCAEETSHLADDEGITGFMHGMAASILSRAWMHGEELKAWKASR